MPLHYFPFYIANITFGYVVYIANITFGNVKGNVLAFTNIANITFGNVKVMLAKAKGNFSNVKSSKRSFFKKSNNK